MAATELRDSVAPRELLAALYFPAFRNCFLGLRDLNKKVCYKQAAKLWIIDHKADVCGATKPWASLKSAPDCPHISPQEKPRTKGTFEGMGQ